MIVFLWEQSSSLNCKKPAFAVEIQQSQKIYSQFTNQHSLLKQVQLSEKESELID